MVTFERLTTDDGDRVSHLQVGEGQGDFVASPALRLQGIGPLEDPWAILQGDDVVGFLVIDRGYCAQHDFADAGDLGLRSVLIDAGRQGQGLGQAAMQGLAGLMAAQYPEASALVLTVNCRNTGARAVYLKSGFTDTGALYHGGRSGPQHILRMTL